MDHLSPQLMHKLVFTVLMHGLNEAQTKLALKVLTDALNHPNTQVRELAVVALADLPVPTVNRVPGLALALGDESSRIRRRAARALGDQGAAAQEAIPQLILGLRDVDVSVRRDCAGALGRLGNAAEEAAPYLVLMLNEAEARTRAVVAVSLKRIGFSAVPSLLEGIRSDDSWLRGRCATLLARIAPHDDQVVQALSEVLADDVDEVRAMADEAMRFVSTPPPMGYVLREQLVEV
jgi:HEAT repeat protein